jgi:hypothetical protein
MEPPPKEAEMPRPRPPGLQRETTRHGKTVWYVRIERGPRIRISAPFGTPEFQAEYQAAITGQPLLGTAQPRGSAFAAHTLGWTIQRYRESAGAKGTWGDLSPATRISVSPSCAMPALRQAASRWRGNSRCDREGYGGTLAECRPAFPLHHARSVSVGGGSTVLQRRSDHWLEADPTQERRLSAVAGGVVSEVYGAWPQGTWERLAFDLLYWTGLRASDAGRIGRQHIQNGVLNIRTKKTDKPVPIPIAPELQAALATAAPTALTFITGANARPLNAATFSARFIRAAALAGVPGSAHGLRKTRATLLAEAGATRGRTRRHHGLARHGDGAVLYAQPERDIIGGTGGQQTGNIYSRTHQEGAGFRGNIIMKTTPYILYRRSRRPSIIRQAISSRSR